MPDIFSSTPGTVAVLTSDSALPGKISIAGVNETSFLYTGLQDTQEAEYTLQNSLQRAVYLYVFGDKTGQLDIHGRVLLLVCGASGTDEGIKNMFALYASKRASAQNEPVVVSIGSETVSGFLVRMKVSTVTLAEDPAGFCYDFTLTLVTLPKDLPA